MNLDLEFWAKIATILSLPISIIALFVGGKAIKKVNNCENKIEGSKIKNSTINQNITRG